MKATILVGSVLLLIPCGGPFAQDKQSTKPSIRFSITPVPPGDSASPQAAPTRNQLLERFPMVVVEKDATLFPMVVTQGRGADYPIYIVPPFSTEQPRTRLNLTKPLPRAPAIKKR